MAFLCFFCKETDVIEWHDVEEGCQPFQPPPRSCRASGSGGGGLQVSRGHSSSPYRIIAETVGEPEARSTYSPPPLNKRSHSGTNKRVRLVKVDIRVPRLEGGPQGTKKVIRLVKIDIRPRPDDDGRREELSGSFVSSPSRGWPFKQHTKAPTRREIRGGSQSPDVGFFNSPSRERETKIKRVSHRHQQEIQEGFDVGSSPGRGRTFVQSITRRREQVCECEAPKDVFSASPSNNSRNKMSPKSQQPNRPRKQIFERPAGSNRSGGSSCLQSPNGTVHETYERAMSHSGAIRGLQSPNQSEQETYERAVSHSWAISGLESPNRPSQATYHRAMSHSGAIRGLQSPNRPLQEIYGRAMSHSGALRGLPSPKRSIQETYERAFSHSGAIRSLQSPNRNLLEIYERPVSHSGAIRCLQSPSRGSGGGYRSSQSPNRHEQGSEGEAESPSPDLGSQLTSPSAEWTSKQRSNLFRRAGSGEIKSSAG